jgi:hypothetical protein
MKAGDTEVCPKGQRPHRVSLGGVDSRGSIGRGAKGDQRRMPAGPSFQDVLPPSARTGGENDVIDLRSGAPEGLRRVVIGGCLVDLGDRDLLLRILHGM